MEKRGCVPKTANTTRLLMSGWCPICKINAILYKTYIAAVLNKAAKKRYVKLTADQTVWGAIHLADEPHHVKNGVIRAYDNLPVCLFPHQSGSRFSNGTVVLVSRSASISIDGLSLSNCIRNSLHAPQGGPTRPSAMTQTSLTILFSPFVIILATAFRSAHIPSEQAASMQTPVYICP